MSRSRRRLNRGQALIEGAITIPLLFVMLLGFYEVSTVVQSDLDLQTAVGLATASAATAPAGDGMVANRYAGLTFQNTVKHFGLLRAPTLSCQGPYQAGDTISCTGRATLALSETPFAEISPSFALQATSRAVISGYRAQAPPGSR